MVDAYLRSRRAIRSIFFASVVLVPAISGAQTLPSAKELIAKYVAATGGDNWKSHKSSRMKATLDMPGAGISASMEVLHIFPSVTYSKVDVPGMGQMLSGSDGTSAWSSNPMTGPRVIATGPELDQLKADADPAAAYTRQSPEIVSSETVEKTTMGGQECYKVKHTWKSGKLSFDCFATADGLLVATTQKQQTPMGEMEMTQVLSGYKDFGGIKRPTTITQEAMGQQQIVTVTAWEWDNVDAKETVAPAEIKAMMEKK